LGYQQEDATVPFGKQQESGGDCGNEMRVAPADMEKCFSMGVIYSGPISLSIFPLAKRIEEAGYDTGGKP
jgi:hypothetical protein